MIKKIINFISWKKFKLSQFLRDFLFSKNLFFEEENFSTKEDIYKTLSKLKPKAIKEDLIRLGPEGDGGYLVPSSIKKCKHLFSPGVSTTTGFDNDCLNMGIRTYFLDKVPPTNIVNSNYHHIKKYLGAKNDNDFISLDEWIKTYENDLAGSNDLVLQCDIEGSEYTALQNVSDENLKRFRILVFELHYLNYLKNRIFLYQFDSFLDRLLGFFSVVHIHPNNARSSVKIKGFDIPKFLEVTFVRTADINLDESKKIKLPHENDRKNLFYENDLKLDKIFID